MIAFFIAAFLIFADLAVFASPVDVHMNDYMHPRYLTTIYQDLGTCRVTAPWAATSTVGGVVGTTTAVEPTTSWISVPLYGTLTATVTAPCVAQRELTTIQVSYYCGQTTTVTRTKTFTDPDVTRYVPTYTATVTGTTTYPWFAQTETTVCA